MKFRNYCIILMGEGLQEALPEIKKIAESDPNVLDAKGVLIATFSSFVEPAELTDYFKLNRRNFLLFDMDKENSGYNIMNVKLHDGLFGFVKMMDLQAQVDRYKQVVSETSGNTETNYYESAYDLNEIEKMSPSEKNKLMDILIDKGIENLSKYDKQILDKLAI